MGLGLGWNYLLCEQDSVIERKKIALLLNSMVYKVEGVEQLLPMKCRIQGKIDNMLNGNLNSLCRSRVDQTIQPNNPK